MAFQDSNGTSACGVCDLPFSTFYSVAVASGGDNACQMAYVVPCRLRDAPSAMQFNRTNGKKTTKENCMINSKLHNVVKGICMGLLAITSLSSYAIENGAT